MAGWSSLKIFLVLLSFVKEREDGQKGSQEKDRGVDKDG